MKCPYCQADNLDGAEFCKFCRRSISGRKEINWTPWLLGSGFVSLLAGAVLLLIMGNASGFVDEITYGLWGMGLLVLGVILLITGVIIGILTRNPPVSEVRLSQIYQPPSKDKFITHTDLRYFTAVIKCSTCKFTDQSALSAGTPWCSSPSPPEIRGSRCYTYTLREPES